MKNKTDIAAPVKNAALAGDALLDCLVFLTAHHGRAKSAEAIRAGLAYDEKGMGPNLFCEAAERMGLKAKIMRRGDIGDIPDAVLPAVLMLKDNRACVLVERAPHGKKAKIFIPGTDVVQEKDVSALAADYAGYTIFVHPRAEFTDPNASASEDLARHWFWGVVLENKGLYGRVAIAAALINLFGLTSSVYIMNVYNRVIPNNAMETGWVLAIGAMTVLIFDFVIRTL
ncbi:MAG TPA: cysteine peptidase family C39 domain-containing protein, partial [Alphaproteobacteria bacterium]